MGNMTAITASRYVGVALFGIGGIVLWARAVGLALRFARFPAPWHYVLRGPTTPVDKEVPNKMIRPQPAIQGVTTSPSSSTP